MWKKAMITASGIGLAVGIGFLISSNRNKEPEKALQETGSKRMLLDLLENLKYEYIPILTSFSQEAAKYKYRPSALKQLQDELEKILNKIDDSFARKHLINGAILNKWIIKYQNEKEVKEYKNIFNNAFAETLKGNIPNMKIMIPSNITKELFFKVFERILAKIRHLYYIKLREIIRDNSGKFTSDDIKRTAQTISGIPIRKNICSKLGLSAPEEDLEVIFKKCLFQYSSNKGHKQELTRMQIKYKLLLAEIYQGVLIPELDADPEDMTDKQFEREMKVIFDKYIKMEDVESLENLSLFIE